MCSSLVSVPDRRLLDPGAGSVQGLTRLSEISTNVKETEHWYDRENPLFSLWAEGWLLCNVYFTCTQISNQRREQIHFKTNGVSHMRERTYILRFLSLCLCLSNCPARVTLIEIPLASLSFSMHLHIACGSEHYDWSAMKRGVAERRILLRDCFEMRADKDERKKKRRPSIKCRRSIARKMKRSVFIPWRMGRKKSVPDLYWVRLHQNTRLVPYRKREDDRRN